MDVCKMQLLNIYFLDTMSQGAVVKLLSDRVPVLVLLRRAQELRTS